MPVIVTNGSPTPFGLTASAIALAFVVGCTSPPPPAPPHASASDGRSIEPTGEQASRADDETVLQAPDSSTEISSAVARVPGTEPILDDAVESVEEVKVTGKRIRRWLPFVGADWPDENCHLSTHRVGSGDLHALFIADLGRNGRMWRDVAQRVSKAGQRAILVTLPGSDGNRPCTWRGAVLAHATELVAALIEDGDEPVSLIGDAFGAHVALEVALKQQERIDNLVLFDLIPFPWPLLNPAFKAVRLSQSAAIFAAQARVAPPGYWSAASGLAAYFEGDFSDEEARREIRRAYRRSDPVTISYEFFRSQGPKADTRPLMIRVGRPILAIQPLGPPGNERKNRDEVSAQYAEVQDVTLHPIPDHGAAAMLEAPTKVADAMLSFWHAIGFDEAQVCGGGGQPNDSSDAVLAEYGLSCTHAHRKVSRES